ncbi:ATP-grasp domain-containing protein [Streptomyces sp. NPDC032940]|uniref:ATP-grasp domain-containing protein n=1 Tax=Streptomyces sp. NPDC032940 TaxID=3155366 RepID=UPI0033C9C902
MLVVVGASDNIARIAQQLEEHVVFVDRHGTRRGGGTADTAARTESFTVDLDDESALAAFADDVLRPRAPRAVVSVTEHGLLPAAVLSARLGTPGTPPDVVRATRDKRLMREVLRAKAPHLTVAHADARDVERVTALLADRGKAVVKPADGTGSAGVTVIRTPDELPSPPGHGAFVVEEFADGDEYSVESFSTDGRHDIIAVAEKGTDGFVEVSHLMPPLLPPHRAELIERAVRELLDALGLENGPAHTEVKLSGDTVKVIETHNRPGGGSIADLVTIVTGVDWRAAALGWPLGVRPAATKPHAAAAATVFFTAPPGRIGRVLDAPPDLPGVTVEYWHIDASPGDMVGELRSSADRLGMAVLSAPSAEACRQGVQTLRTHTVIATEGVAP